MREGRLARAADAMTQDVDGEFLVMRAGCDDVLHLDAVASDVWRALGEETTRQALVDDLAAVYGIDRARAAGDLEPLLELLRQHGLIVERLSR